MTDVLEFSSSGSKPDKIVDPDEALVRDGLRDEQTGRVKKQVAISNRSRAAASLKAYGASYAEIAEELEYSSPAAARAAVELVLAEHIDESKDYSALRAVASLRLEGLLKAVASRAMDQEDGEQLAYHRAAMSVVDRWIKLHGLDAPQRLQFVNPSTEEFEMVIAAMVGHANPADVVEPDILELEAVPIAEWDASDDEA